jgi:DNA-binding transcriptional ArsR family regulator
VRSRVVVRTDLRDWYPTGYVSLVDIFGVLADPVRRALLEELALEPRRVVDLAATRPISRPAVSKHLRLLLESGAVTVTARGRERLYALDRTALVPVASYVAALGVTSTAPVTGQALDALETEVRRTGRERRPIARREDEHEETA